MATVDVAADGGQDEVHRPGLADDVLDISVVMPCLNEAGSVATCVAKAFTGIRKAGLIGEVVVVDNGSNDGSAEIALRAGARVVHQPLRGYGNAYRLGFSEARGRVIVMGDSDDSYDFTEIPALISPLGRGADYVLGSRFAGEIQKGAMTWSHRHVGNPMLTWMLNVLFGLKSSDAHSGLRAFRREALEEMNLRCEGMELASEIVVKAARAGLNVAEVPIVYHPRTGESKLNSFRDAWRHMRFLLLLSPLHVFLWPGTLLLGAGAAGEAAILAFDHTSTGLRLSILAVCLMLLGVQLIVLGLFAKTHSYRSGFEPESAVSRFMESTFSLEKGLVLSGAMAAAGAAIASLPLFAGSPRHTLVVQLASFGIGTLAMAAQVAFCSFFLAIFRAPFERANATIVLS